MVISRLSGIGCSTAWAGVAKTVGSKSDRALEIHTPLCLLVEQKNPVGWYVHPDQLIEIGAKIAVCPHGQKIVADPYADERIFTREFGGIDGCGKVAFAGAIEQHCYVFGPHSRDRPFDCSASETLNAQTAGGEENPAANFAGNQVHWR